MQSISDTVVDFRCCTYTGAAEVPRPLQSQLPGAPKSEWTHAFQMHGSFSILAERTCV